MDTKKILLAEDNLNDVELVMAALTDQGLANQVVAVEDGVDAVDYLRRRGKFADRANENPVVVLLDLKMPKMDGLQVLAEMKKDDVLRHIPVVILTSSREERDLVESYNLGVNAYVVKPVVFEKFMEAIRRIGLFWVLTNELPPNSRPESTKV